MNKKEYFLGEYVDKRLETFESLEDCNAREQYFNNLNKELLIMITEKVKENGEYKLSYYIVNPLKKLGVNLINADEYTMNFINATDLKNNLLNKPNEKSPNTFANIHLFKKSGEKINEVEIVYNIDIKYIEDKMCKKIFLSLSNNINFLNVLRNDAYLLKIKSIKKELTENLSDRILEYNENKNYGKEITISFHTGTKNILDNLYNKLVYRENAKINYSQLRYLYLLCKNYYFKLEKTKKLNKEKERIIEVSHHVNNNLEEQLGMEEVIGKEKLNSNEINKHIKI